jgi:hypothetical protein
MRGARIDSQCEPLLFSFARVKRVFEYKETGFNLFVLLKWKWWQKQPPFICDARRSTPAFDLYFFFDGGSRAQVMPNELLKIWYLSFLKYWGVVVWIFIL